MNRTIKYRFGLMGGLIILGCLLFCGWKFPYLRPLPEPAVWKFIDGHMQEYEAPSNLEHTAIGDLAPVRTRVGPVIARYWQASSRCHNAFAVEDYDAQTNSGWVAFCYRESGGEHVSDILLFDGYRLKEQ